MFLQSGIELICQREEEQAFVHDMYVGELLKNRFLPETLERMLVLIQTLKERDSVEGVILAGTELPLLLTSDSACGIPLLDTTRIHVMAAVEQAWGEQLGSVD